MSTDADASRNGSVADIDCHQATQRASEASQYLLRAPFSLEKITWNETSRKVIYRSKRSWHTKKNFKIFEVTDFLAAAVEHIPPKNQQCRAAQAACNLSEAKPHGRSRRRSQTIRYYGRYSNKRRGWDFKNGVRPPVMVRPPISDATPKQARQPETLFILPAPGMRSKRFLKPLWRDLILKTWGEDPMRCPCCKEMMKNAGTMMRRDEVDCPANARLVARHEPVSLSEYRKETRKECAAGALNFFFACMVSGKGSSHFHRRPIRPSTSKTAEGPEAFWTEFRGRGTKPTG